MKISYTKTDQEFAKQLRTRVNQYFKDNHLAKNGGRIEFFKAIFLIIMYFLTSVSLWNSENIFILFGCYVIVGMLIPLIVLNIVHDASHGALTKNKKINDLFLYSANIIGLNAHSFKLRHLYGHHSHSNIKDYDLDLSISFIRLYDDQKVQFHHRFQIIMGILFPFVLGFMAFMNNFFDLFRKQVGNKAIIKFNWNQLFIITISKSWHIVSLIFLPHFICGHSWLTVIVGFTIAQFIFGLISWIVAIPNHAVEDIEFYSVGKNGEINHSWIIHQFNTTSDFITHSKFFHFVFGGFNHHVAHHLFQDISYCHYPAVTKIVKETAKEFNVNYKSIDTFFEAYISHFKLLKQKGIDREYISHFQIGN